MRVRIEGEAEIVRRFKALGNQAVYHLVTAGRAGGNVIATEARRLARKRSGNLERSIIVVDPTINGTQVECKIGTKKDGWYGRLLEKGTNKMPAYPFMRPAMDNKKEDAKKAARDSLAATLLGR